MILHCKKTEVEHIGPILDAISTAIYSIKPDCERLFRRMSFEERYRLEQKNLSFNLLGTGYPISLFAKIF